MPPFTCYRCMKPFNQKIHLINHLKRKKKCPPTHADVSSESLLDELISPHKNCPLSPQEQQPTEPVAVAVAVNTTTTTPAVITNSGGINFFIFPGLKGGAEPGETKILSSVNFNDIGTAINALLGFIVNKQQPQLPEESDEDA